MEKNLFDDNDCEICKAQSLAIDQGRDITHFELMEAVEKQKKSGIGLVGCEDDLFSL